METNVNLLSLLHNAHSSSKDLPFSSLSLTLEQAKYPSGLFSLHAIHSPPVSSEEHFSLLCYGGLANYLNLEEQRHQEGSRFKGVFLVFPSSWLLLYFWRVHRGFNLYLLQFLLFSSLSFLSALSLHLKGTVPSTASCPVAVPQIHSRSDGKVSASRRRRAIQPLDSRSIRCLASSHTPC
jgi:hypothetical protein